MSSSPEELEAARVLLEHARAFDPVSHDKLMDVVASLPDGLLPAHDTRKLFSADPDLHVLFAEGVVDVMSEQAMPYSDAVGQARAVYAQLLGI